MKKFKETGKVFCKIMNKGKEEDKSTFNSQSQQLSSGIEQQNEPRPPDLYQNFDMAEHMRMLNEGFLMQEAYLQWVNL